MLALFLFVFRIVFISATWSNSSIIEEKNGYFDVDISNIVNGETVYLAKKMAGEAAGPLWQTLTLETKQLTSEELKLAVPPSDYMIELHIDDTVHYLQPSTQQTRYISFTMTNTTVTVQLYVPDSVPGQPIFYKMLSVLSAERYDTWQMYNGYLGVLLLAPILIGMICMVFIYLFILRHRFILLLISFWFITLIYEFYFKTDILRHLQAMGMTTFFHLKMYTIISLAYMLIAIFLLHLYIIRRHIRTIFTRIIFIAHGFVLIAVVWVPYTHFAAVQATYHVLYIATICYIIYTLVQIRIDKKKTILIGLVMIGTVNGVIWQSISSTLPMRVFIYPLDYLVVEVGLLVLFMYQYYEGTQEAKLIAEQLRQTNQLKDDFLRKNAEKLNRPFHKMMTLTSELSAGADEHALQLLHRLKLEQKTAYYFILEKLDYVSLLEGELQFERKEVDVNRLIVNTTELLQELLIANNVVLHIEREAASYTTIGDEQRFGQVYYYLLRLLIVENYGGTVHVRLFTRDDQLYVELQGGMLQSEAQLRGAISYTLCEELVKRQGCRLTLHCANNIATITVQMARHATAEIEDAWQTYEPMVARRDEAMYAVLFVTNDISYVELGHSILAPPVYGTEFVRTQAEVEARIFARSWDLIIMDTMQIDVERERLIRWLRTHFSAAELPILYLTPSLQFYEMPDMLSLGVNDFLVKPIMPIELKFRAMNLLLLKKTLQEQAELEHSLLRTQIEPHFLFNTLNAIASLSEVDQNKMVDLLHHFGNYLQSSFNEQMRKRLVPLQLELELVQAYIAIEEVRFAPHLFVVWDIDETVDLHVPPFAIQTLVENAIRHGIRQKDGSGTVCIIVERDVAAAHLVHIRIADDGVGMAQEKIDALLSGESSGGIGILNTNARIKRMYDEGLTIVSERDGGTVVSFTVDTSKSYV